MEIKSKFDISYITRLFLITLVFVLTVFLGGKYGLNLSLLVADSISLILTPIVWKLDGILKFDLKVKYVAYYVALLIFSILLFPKDLSTIVNILYRNGFREEVLFRFFMVGIFYKYNTAENGGNERKLLYAILISNGLFMMGHPYNWIGLVSVFVFGIVFTMIYMNGGLPSAIIAHALHNFYRTIDIYLLSLLLILPLVKKYLLPASQVIQIKKFFRIKTL